MNYIETYWTVSSYQNKSGVPKSRTLTRSSYRFNKTAAFLTANHSFICSTYYSITLSIDMGFLDPIDTGVQLSVRSNVLAASTTEIITTPSRHGPPSSHTSHSASVVSLTVYALSPLLISFLASPLSLQVASKDASSSPRRQVPLVSQSLKVRAPGSYCSTSLRCHS